jgi:hypothetical protein
MGLWDSIGSVALIAIMMERSSSSVQTQASRLGLPPRAEEKDRHRRRWAEGDDEILEEVVNELTRPDGRIPIKEVAIRMGRSVDAIVVRLESLYGEDSSILSRLEVPPPPEVLEPPKPRIKTLPGKRDSGEGTKKCLRCSKEFWSEGRHNWICVTCKRSDDWSFDL